MDYSLRRPQLYWNKELPPKLNTDNHPDLPPSKSPADFYGDTRQRNHHQSKRLESAEKAWLHTLPWSYADAVINKPRRHPVNNQDNVEFKNSCFSNMIWKSAESNDQAHTEEVNSESSEGDSFLNPNANEFVPEIQSNDHKETASQSNEEKRTSHSSKNSVNDDDDDGTTQEQCIASESNDSCNAEEISVITRSTDETTVQEDIESASQTNTIYEVLELDKQNVEINPSLACEEENIVIKTEGEIDTTPQNQLTGVESIIDCDESEIQHANENEEQDDQSSQKSQAEQTYIETNLGFELSSKNLNDNEELANERQEIKLEPKSIGSDQAEFECQSLGIEAQVESETPELDNANMEQMESEIPANYTEAQIESDDLESNNIYKTKTESEEIPKSDPIKEAQPGPKPEEPYNDGESIAESEFSEIVIPSEAQANSEILEPYNAAQFQEGSEIQDSYNVTQVQAESEILDDSFGSEAHAGSEIQEPCNAAQLDEELEIQDSYNFTQLQAESEILDASIASQTQVVSEIQESYNAPQSQEEPETLEAYNALQLKEELKIQESNNATEFLGESKVNESYDPTELQEESKFQESYQATPLQEESEVQESYQATPLQEESEVQDLYQATRLQEESEVQESYQATPLQEESEVQESYQATLPQEESEVQGSYQETPLQEESEVQESYQATLLQEESEVQDSVIVGKTQDESEQSGSNMLSHDHSVETVLNKSPDSNSHAVTEKRNLKKAKQVTDSDEIKSVQDHLGNNKKSSDGASHQDVDKENTAVAPEQTTTKKNKKRRNKKKNKVNNQLNTGIDFDELVKDKTNYFENHSNNDESTNSTGRHQSAETNRSPNQSHTEAEAKLTNESEINEEPSLKDNGTKDLKDESCQNNIVDDENNLIEFKNEHFDINEVDKFIEEEKKALAEFPNELDVENQMKLEEELAEIALPKQNEEEQEENISNEVKEETNNQNDNVLFDKEDSAIIKDDAASLAASSDHESSFEIINEYAARDDGLDINQSSQDLLIDDGNLDEDEIKNKNNEMLSPTVTISSEISSIPQDDNVENRTYDISVPKELDINKNETVLSAQPLVVQNDHPHIAGIDNTTENVDISMQEDHFSKPVETMSEKFSNEPFDATRTIGATDDREIAEKGEAIILNENLVTDESVNYKNKETPIITERPPLSPHDTVSDDKIVAYVTQIEKPDVMNGEENSPKLPDQLEINNLESNLINNEVPKTKGDNVNDEDLERNKMYRADEIPTEQIDMTKNEETSSRSRTEEKSDLATSFTDFEPKLNEDLTMSDEIADEKMLKEIINKLPTRVKPTSITELDDESPAIQELSTIAEITERTVSELPDDNTGHIVHPESDVETSEKIIETIKSQEEEGISNESEKSLRTEYENSNSCQRGDGTLSPGNLTESGKRDPIKNKMTVSAAIKPKTIDIKTTSKPAPKVPAKTSSKPTTTSSKPAATTGATKLSSVGSAKPAPGTSKLASTSTIKTAKPSAASAKPAAADVAKQAAGTVKSSTSSVKQVTAVSKSAAPGSPKPTTTKTAIGAAIKIGSKAPSPAKPTVTTIKIAIKAASTKPTTPPSKMVAAVKPPTPPLKISLTTKPSTPPKPAKTSSKPTTAPKPLTPTSKANLAAAVSLPAKPDSSTNSITSATSTTMKKPSTPTSKSVDKSSLKTSSASSKPSSATRITSSSSKTPQPIKKLPSNSPKPAAAPTKATSESPTKTPVKNTTEPSKTIVKSLSEQSKSTRTSSSSSSTKLSITDKTKTPSSPKTSSKSPVTVKKLTPTSGKDKTVKSPIKADDKNVKKSIKTSSNKDHQNNEKNGTLNEVTSTTDYISSDNGLSPLSELAPQIIV